MIATYILKGQTANQFNVCFGYGVGAMIATLACGHISGAHINPAGTVAMAVFGKHAWWKVPYYLLAQYLAGFISSIVIYCVYYDGFSHFDKVLKDMPGLYAATVFTTYPWDHTTLRGVLVDQVSSRKQLSSLKILS